MINRLGELYSRFENGHMDKRLYVKRMHDIHKILWEYRDFIHNKNIQSINISENGLLFTTKNGIIMTCDSADERSVPMEILDFGDYETVEMQIVRKLLDKDSVIIDIGANIGWYPLSLSAYVPYGRIIAFEPVKRTFEYLKNNIKLNKVKNIDIYNYGLSDKAGMFNFYYNPKFTAASSLRDLHSDKRTKRITCRLRRMDDFILKLTSRIDLVKCDVEGAEIYVIKGALESLTKTRPILFVEMLRKWSAKFGYHPNNTIDLLKSIGYSCYYTKNGRMVKINRIGEKTKATNFYFMDPEKHAKIIRQLS